MAPPLSLPWILANHGRGQSGATRSPEGGASGVQGLGQLEAGKVVLADFP